VYKENYITILMALLPGFIGNLNEYNQLITWLKLPNNVYGKFLSKDSIIIISGASGCGKSYGIRKAINESNKNMCYINKDECINSKDFKDLILKQTQSNILDQFNLVNTFNSISLEDTNNNLGSNPETVIFIDDIDTLLAVDRSFINNFNALITSNTVKAIKIVISCISSELKIILKSIIFGQIILLKTPSDNDIRLFLYITNNIQQSNQSNQSTNQVNTNLINECINTAKGDICVAQNIYTINSNTSKVCNISNKIIKNQDNFIKQTDIFPEVAKIYYMEDRSLIRKIVEQDPWLHPLRFHENIIHEFKQRKSTKEIKDKTYINILDNLCKWDQLMVASKGGDISYAIEQACISILLLTPIKRKKLADPPLDEFTRMFNYLSLRKKNMVSLYEGNFTWETIGSSRKKLYEGFIRKESITNKNKNKTRVRTNTKKLPI
jgi:hypothetical protein